MPSADYIVPNMLKAANLSSILLGIIVVLLLSASVSTLCSITLSASSTLTIDLVATKIKPDIDDNGKSRLTKFYACCLLYFLTWSQIQRPRYLI